MTRILYFISLTLLVSSCSVFQDSRKIDMAPF